MNFFLSWLYPFNPLRADTTDVRPKTLHIFITRSSVFAHRAIIISWILFACIHDLFVAIRRSKAKLGWTTRRRSSKWKIGYYRYMRCSLVGDFRRPKSACCVNRVLTTHVVDIQMIVVLSCRRTAEKSRRQITYIYIYTHRCVCVCVCVE